MQKIYNCFLGVLLLWGGLSCSKIKVDPDVVNNNVLTTTNSGIRLFNFTNGNLNLAVNNVQLTSFDPVSSTVGPGSQGTEIGMKYFPVGVWKSGNDGTPFTVPNTLLNRKGEARILVAPAKITTTLEYTGNVNIDTTVVDDPLHPKDYYILSKGNVVAVPRTIEVPVQPDHFKIRVVNLSSPKDTLGLYGPITLTYSNGKPVDPALTNVAPDAASPYVELPYGTLQFKLFVNGDFSKQLTEVGSNPRFDACHNIAGIQQGIDPLVRTFKPGGTYAIVITRTNFFFVGCAGSGDRITVPVNGYRIITENSAPLNTAYARLQCVNALPGRSISPRLDSSNLSALVPYTENSGYTSVIATSHLLQVYDDKGGLLAEKPYTFSASDNVTAWIFEKEGKAEIAFMQNRLSAYYYQSNKPDSSDGTDGTIHIATYGYVWQSRLLNLSADVPSVTFSNDGKPFYTLLTYNGNIKDTFNLPTAYQNLAPGYATTHDPYIIVPYRPNDYNNAGGLFDLTPVIRAHRSDQQIPGPLLINVPPLKFSDFIANTGMYQPGNAPKSETGVYTVALVGRNSADPASVERLKLIYIKHNQ